MADFRTWIFKNVGLGLSSWIIAVNDGRYKEYISEKFICWHGLGK